MKLDAILSADRIAVDAAATSKKRTLEEISRLLASGDDDVNVEDILGSLANREKLGSTGLGHGVAIPHGRIAGIQDSVGAFIRLRHPVDYEAHDGNPVDLIFGLLVPQHGNSEHLKHLAMIAEKFSDEDFCSKVRSVTDRDVLLTLLTA